MKNSREISIKEINDFTKKLNEDWSKLNNVKIDNLAWILNNFNYHIKKLENENKFLKQENDVMKKDPNIIKLFLKNLLDG